MVRAPDWNEDEFRILVTSYGLSDDELRSRLPNRSIGAIDIVREGVHAYHTGGNITMLSQMMRTYLSRNRSKLTCPKCGATF
jgi:hypothetical protein